MKYFLVTRPEGDANLGYAVETPTGAVFVVWWRCSESRWVLCADREAAEEAVGELTFQEATGSGDGSFPIQERFLVSATRAVREAAIVARALGIPEQDIQMLIAAA